MQGQMARKKKEENSFSELSKQFAETFKKESKGLTTETIYATKADSIDNVDYWVDTGSSFLNLAISNKKEGGGYPSGRMTILFGEEQSGKSLLCMHSIASTQKMGGFGLYIDCERAFHEGFAKAIGVNLEENFMRLPESNIGVILQYIEKWIYTARKTFDKSIPLTICLDSLTAAKTEEDLKGAYDEDIGGYKTSMPLLLSRALPKLIPLIEEHNICFLITTQVRQNFNRKNIYDSEFRMAGGQSVPHYASVIVRLKKAAQIKGMHNNIERVIGRKVRATIEKNRLGPPLSKVEFYVYFDRGVDDYESWEFFVKKFNILKIKKGGWINYQQIDMETGELVDRRIQGWNNFVEEVLKNGSEEYRKQFFEEMAEKFITAYNTSSDKIQRITDEEE